jgi:hypothetical protein
MATFGSPGGTRQLRHGSRNAVSSWASITRKVVILSIDLPHIAPGETGRVGSTRPVFWRSGRQAQPAAQRLRLASTNVTPG